MVKRTFNMPETEPDMKEFKIPSEKEHLFQVVDVYTSNDETGRKFGLDDDTVIAKLEVCGGDEEGRSMLNRVTLDESHKGFFATRLFLKAIGEDHKGQVTIDTDFWPGKQFYATVIHQEHKGKIYANIGNYNFDKQVEQISITSQKKSSDEIAWDE